MKTAFKPKPIVFMHICKNCSNCKVVFVDKRKRYICRFDGVMRYPGDKCEIPFTEDDNEQMTMDI